jgi:hypothetical protein
MLVVVILADPAPDSGFVGFCVVESQATFRANTAFAVSSPERAANVEIDGASRTMFFNHVTSSKQS